MTRIGSVRMSVAALGTAMILVAMPGARASDPVTITRAVLHTPPDSHEPQRALVEVANPGSDGGPAVTVTCAFLGRHGATLDSASAAVPRVAGQAGTRVEIIYYGYPRARRVECRVAPSPSKDPFT